jgi:hypothetical protein
MEVKDFTFKGNGDRLLNDVACPDIFDLEKYSYEFILKPKTNFWRFGIRISRNFNSDRTRYRDKDVKHLEISAGEYKEGNWQRPHFLFLQEYYVRVKDKGDTINSWMTYLPGGEVYLSLAKGNGQFLNITSGAQNCPSFSTIFPIGEFKFFQLFGWADAIDFEFDVTIRFLNPEDLEKTKRINDLWKKILDNNLPKDSFTIYTDSSSINVTVINSKSFFLVDQTSNELFFTIERNPESKNKGFKYTDNFWHDVIKEFQEWINDISSLNANLNFLDLSKAKGVLLIEGAANYQFRNESIKPSLNVEAQVAIFLKLIKAISSSNENGLLLGIFGKWGRGKTFFWNEFKRKLLLEASMEYEPIEFHAWKYQDTPASWAYLYEIFASKFYKKELSTFFGKAPLWFSKSWNRIKLNKKRLGSFRFYITLIIVPLAGVWYFWPNLTDKIRFVETIIYGLGLATIISAIMYYRSFSGLAKDFFKSYFTKKSFTDLLGIQAEIQKELVILLNSWIPESKMAKKKIVLFVDDIDRCDENRIIQVIDSLKVMIDNPEISNRVIIIAAIDEEVLKRAIKQKYYNLVNNDLAINEKEKEKELESIAREYVDKLFINGFRLGTLTQEEKIKMFDSLTENKIFYRNKEEPSAISSPTNNDNIKTLVNGNDSEKGGKAFDSGLNYEDFISVQPKDEFELMDYEVPILQKALRKFKAVTPRSLRIFYFRYLLTKDFMELLLGGRMSQISMEWHSNQDRKVLLPYLLIIYSKEKTYKDLLDRIDTVTESFEPNIPLEFFGEKFVLSKELYLVLLRVVATVVPY